MSDKLKDKIGLLVSACVYSACVCVCVCVCVCENVLEMQKHIVDVRVDLKE